MFISADDWGISPGVNDGILELAQDGIIRRVSAFAPSAFLNHGLSDLLKVPDLEIGLHFNLTYNADFSGPGDYLKKWFFLNQAEKEELKAKIKKEFERQFSALRSAVPKIEHVDGHQHLHLFPGVWETISPLMKERGIKKTRYAYEFPLWFSSKAVLNILSLRLKNEITKNFETLPFAYPSEKVFSSTTNLQGYLKRKKGCEVLVHPAAKMDFEELNIQDGLRERRLLEFHALKGLRAG